jgi:hypothetical protein
MSKPLTRGNALIPILLVALKAVEPVRIEASVAVGAVA